MSGPVDVLAVLGSFLKLGGIGPVQVVAKWNTPRGTGLIANRAHSTTAATLRALQRAERDGLVSCVGTGAEHCPAWNKSVAEERERYWTLTANALARIGGAA